LTPMDEWPGLSRPKPLAQPPVRRLPNISG
jgi:hypothetical protein